MYKRTKEQTKDQPAFESWGVSAGLGAVCRVKLFLLVLMITAFLTAELLKSSWKATDFLMQFNIYSFLLCSDMFEIIWSSRCKCHLSSSEARNKKYFWQNHCLTNRAVRYYCVIDCMYVMSPQAAADGCQLKRLTLLRVRRGGMLYPHYAGAWDSVAWCGEARMTFRNAIVVHSIPSPNAPCSIRLMVLFSRMRYPRVPGAREGRRGP